MLAASRPIWTSLAVLGWLLAGSVLPVRADMFHFIKVASWDVTDKNNMEQGGADSGLFQYLAHAFAADKHDKQHEDKPANPQGNALPRQLAFDRDDKKFADFNGKPMYDQHGKFGK